MTPLVDFGAPYAFSNEPGANDEDASDCEFIDKSLGGSESCDGLACSHVCPETGVVSGAEESDGGVLVIRE